MGRVSNARENLLEAIIDLMWAQSYGSVTVDAICERAGVKKGSFYYFFKSKTDLTLEALEHLWLQVRPELDEVFSASVPPMDRILKKVERCHTRATEQKEQHGRVLGCPYFNIGSEICSVEPELRNKVLEILARYHNYFESAIRDGQADGSIRVDDPKAVTRSLFNLMEGTLTRARIDNDPDVVRDLKGAVVRLLGAHASMETAAA